MTARKKPPATLADQEFEHMHVLGPILWAIVVYTGALVLHLANAPVAYVVLIGAGATLLAPLVAIHRRFAFLLMLATTALLTWTTATTPLQPAPAYAAAGGGLLFGLAYRALRKHEPVEDDDKTAQQAASKGRYVELLETIGAKGLRELRRDPMPAGKTVVLLLPIKGNVTLSALKQKVEQLEIAAARAGLDETYQFEASPDSRAEVYLHVFERDVLAETLPLEFDRTPQPASIHTAVPLGQFPTGEECGLLFREVAELLVGVKGKGKSNLINVHLAHLTRCSDAVVWMLDGKGDRTVGPWIESYLNGETNRPAIDWPAINQVEQDAILMAVNAAIEFRAGPGRRSKGEKIEPTPDLPSIVTIVEEASMITGVTRSGGRQRVQLAQDGVVRGRSEACDWLFATQRATVTMLGNGDMKSNLDVRIGLGVTEEADARSIFGDGKFAKALFQLGSSRKYRGVFLMQHDDGRVMPVKGYRIEPEAIYGMAAHNSRYAGTLDRGTADFVHERLIAAGVPGGYYGRWDRIREALGRDDGTSQAETVGRDAGTPETTRAETVGRDAGTSQGQAGRQAVEEAVSAARAKREAERLDETFEALVAQLRPDLETVGKPSQVDELPDSVPPILRLTRAVFLARDADALPSRVICDDLPGDLTQTMLGRLMGHCNVSGGEVIWDGKRARGYTWDAIETAIKRGSWTDKASEWKP